MAQNKRKFFFIIGFIFSAIPLSLALGAPSGSEILLSTAIHRVWDTAPQLQALETQISLADQDKIRRFIPNEPQISYLKDESDQSQTYGVQLTFGFPGKAFAYSNLDSALARKQRFERAAKKYELAAQVAQAYLDCAAAQAIIQVREGTISELEAFLQSLKSRRGVTQIEKISFELETRQTKQDLLSARDTQDVRCQKLKTLMTDSNKETPILVLPDDIDPSLMNELGSSTADENRAHAAAGLADANFSTAGWSQMPDFTFNYSQKHTPDGASGAGEQWYPAYGLSVTLPILFPFYESVEVHRTRSQAIIDKGDAALQIIQSDADRMDAARSFVHSRNYLKELRRRDLPLGQALLESAYSAYRGGQIGYADMVLSRKTLIDLRLKDVELRTNIVSARIKCLNLCELNDQKSDFKKDSSQ